MADAYARMSGRLGVVSVHQGCGLTSATTGIGEAAKSRTPVLVLAAETAGAAVNSNFAMDQDALASSVGAESHRVHSAASAVVDTLDAVTDWLASDPAAPLLIDAKIGSDGGSWWLTEAFKGH